MQAHYAFLLLLILANILMQAWICGTALHRQTKNLKNASNIVRILVPWEAYALIFLLVADYVLGFLFVFLNNRLNGSGDLESLRIAFRAVGYFTILPFDLVIIVLTFYLLTVSHKQQKEENISTQAKDADMPQMIIYRKKVKILLGIYIICTTILAFALHFDPLHSTIYMWLVVTLYLVGICILVAEGIRWRKVKQSKDK